jgi:hypothetical protein
VRVRHDAAEVLGSSLPPGVLGGTTPSSPWPLLRTGDGNNRRGGGVAVAVLAMLVCDDTTVVVALRRWFLAVCRFFVDACVLIFSKRNKMRPAKPASRPALSGYQQLSPSLIPTIRIPSSCFRQIPSFLQTNFSERTTLLLFDLVQSSPTPSRLSVDGSSCFPTKRTVLLFRHHRQLLGSTTTNLSRAAEPDSIRDRFR